MNFADPVHTYQRPIELCWNVIQTWLARRSKAYAYFIYNVYTLLGLFCIQIAIIAKTLIPNGIEHAENSRFSTADLILTKMDPKYAIFNMFNSAGNLRFYNYSKTKAK